MQMSTMQMSTMQMSTLRWIFGMMVLLGTTSEVFAQIVNVQPLLAAETKQGLSAVLEGKVDWRAGNTNLLTLTASGVGRYRGGRHFALLMLKREYGFADAARILDRELEHLRYRYDVFPRVGWEVFVQHDKDDFRRLALRALAGTGPRWQMVQNPHWELAVAAAYMLEYERLASSGEWLDAGTQFLAHRLSTYLVATFRLEERLRLGQTLYVQPLLSRWSDFRVLGVTELMATVSERLSMSLALSLAYDTRPPIAVKTLDVGILGGLAISF